MKENYTDITIVLDRSGSMADVAADTIGGFNRFLADQQAAPGEATFTLHQFDDQYETVYDGVAIKDVKPLTDKTFVPRGNTALNDATGRSIINTGARLEKLPESERPKKVVFVIITDGMENASKEYTLEKVNEMIKHQKEKYLWEFVFIGAEQNAVESGGAMGISSTHSLSNAKNSAGTQALYASASSNLRKFRAGGASCMAFTDEDREEQISAGAMLDAMSAKLTGKGKKGGKKK